MGTQAYSLATGTNGTATFAGTAGDKFTVGGASIRITALGAFVDAAAAWTASKTVAIYNGSGTLLTSVTISPSDIGVSATMVGQYAIKSITPITIAASSANCVAAAWGYGTDKFAKATNGVTPTTDTGGGLISFVGSAVFDPSPATYPVNVGGEPSPAGFVGPNFVFDNGASASAAITETPLPANHAGNLTVNAVGTGTAWSSSTTWTASGVSGWSVASKTFVDSTHYTIVLTPPTAATPPVGATGTLTLTEGVTGSATATTTIGTPAVSISPTSGSTGATPSLAITGTNTRWSSETPAGLFTVTGGTGASVATPTVTTDTAATATLTVGSAAGTLTVKDVSTGATASFAASVPATVLAPNAAAIVYSPYNWNATGTAATTVNPGAYFSLLFDGASITLAFDTSAAFTGSLNWYRVDGGAWVSWTYAASLAITGLTSNQHLFEFVYAGTTISNNRWNSGQKSGVVLTSITLGAGATAAAPTRAPYNVLVYGDSITEGCLDRAGSQPASNDALAAWSYSLRELLGCEVGVVGFGSQGWTVAGQGNVPAFSSSWNLLYSGVSRSFSAAPDLVVIAHGQNDYSTSASTGSVATAMATVIAGLLAAGAKKVLCLGPLSGGYKTTIQAGAATAGVSYADASAVLVSVDYSDGLHPWASASRAKYGPWVAGQVKSIAGLSGGTVTIFPNSLNGGFQ